MASLPLLLLLSSKLPKVFCCLPLFFLPPAPPHTHPTIHIRKLVIKYADDVVLLLPNSGSFSFSDYPNVITEVSVGSSNIISLSIPKNLWALCFLIWNAPNAPFLRTLTPQQLLMGNNCAVKFLGVVLNRILTCSQHVKCIFAKIGFHSF